MKLKKLFSSVCSVLTAASILVASESVFPLGVSAAVNNQLNLRIFMCTSMCNNFHECMSSDDIAYGTYGVPTSFTTRLSYITSYLYGYYMNVGACINTIFSSSDSIVDSPASECASDYGSQYFYVLINGCQYYTDDQCFSGELHCNNLVKFQNDIPAYNPENECAVYLTASRLCSNNNGSHHNVYGVCVKEDMYITACDADYRKSHGDNPTSTDAYAYARSTLVHEVGHLYNVSDHQNTDVSADCLWGKNSGDYDNIRSCSTCSTCHNTIYNNRNLYQHIDPA